MAKIAVFDSGLGSLSIIKAIQKVSVRDHLFCRPTKYPYGNKSQAQISKIIQKSIKLLEEKFSPDIIVVASNTPSLMLNITTKRIIE